MSTNDAAGAAEASTIRGLEDRRYQAMIDKDVGTLDALLHDDLAYTHSNALSDTKASYLEGIRAGKWNYRKIARPAESIRVYGATAIVTGHVRIDILMDGAPKQLNSRYVNVWLKGARGWQMAVWQSTPIPA